MSKIIADIMVPAPIVVEVPGSRSDAINIMVRNKLTGLPVVRASDGKLMGIVSRRDIFRKFDEDQLSLIMSRMCVCQFFHCAMKFLLICLDHGLYRITFLYRWKKDCQR